MIVALIELRIAGNISWMSRNYKRIRVRGIEIRDS